MIQNAVYLKVAKNGIVFKIDISKKHLKLGLTELLVRKALTEADVVVGSDVSKAVANLKIMLTKLDLLYN